MDGRQEELDEVQTYWDHTTVPVVVLLEDDKEIFIGGYTELKEHLETKEV